jgi:hypothetical protein
MVQTQSELVLEIYKLNEIIQNMHSEASKKTFSNDYMDSDEYTMRNKSA